MRYGECEKCTNELEPDGPRCCFQCYRELEAKAALIDELKEEIAELKAYINLMKK